jgi:O-antigen ligase
MGIVRLMGVDQTMNDPNAFAATLLYALALVPAAWFISSSAAWRGFVVCYAILSVGCMALTGSRAAFVALVLWVSVSILRSRYRVAFGAVALAAAPFLWALLPPSLQNRFETIINPDVGPLNARVSAEGRFEGFWLGVELWQASPLTGCGPGAWRPASGRKLESHNLYGQVMGELGLLGMVALAAVVLTYWLTTRRIRRAYRDHPEWDRDFLYHLSWCLEMVLLLLLLNGTFGHNLYRYTWQWCGAFAIITLHCVRQRQAEEAESVSEEPEEAEEEQLNWGGAPA